MKIVEKIVVRKLPEGCTNCEFIKEDKFGKYGCMINKALKIKNTDWAVRHKKCYLTEESRVKQLIKKDLAKPKTESIEEQGARWNKCQQRLIEMRGRIITQVQAKEIYKLCEGGYAIEEKRLSDEMSVVILRRTYHRVEGTYTYEGTGTANVFIVKGNSANILICDSLCS